MDIVEDFISPVGTLGRPDTTFTYVMPCRRNPRLVDGVLSARCKTTVDDAPVMSAQVRARPPWI
jgi:hypothetical protein